MRAHTHTRNHAQELLEDQAARHNSMLWIRATVEGMTTHLTQDAKESSLNKVGERSWSIEVDSSEWYEEH